MVLAVGLVDLVERLRDQEGAQAVAGHEGQRALEEVEPTQCRELVEHQQQLVAAGNAVRAIERLGQASADLVENQADQRLGATDVRGRHHQVQRHRMIGIDQVGDAPVAARGDFGHRGIAVQAQETHRGGQHTRALVFALVQHLARGRCDNRVRCFAQVSRRHHPVQRDLERAGRIGQEVGDAAQRLVFAGVEHMQDRADQQGMRSLLPMVAPLQRAFGIDQDVGDVLHVAHFVHAAPHFEQRVVGSRARIGRVEQQAVREARAPTGGQVPVLALDVVDDGGAGPRKQRGHHQADTLAGAGRREGHHMLGTFVAQVVAVLAAQENAGRAGQAGTADFSGQRPACRTVGRDQLGLPCTPHRHGDGDDGTGEAAACCDGTAAQEDVGRIGIEEVPPLEQPPRVIDRRSEQVEPRRAEAHLVSQCSRRPLGGTP